MTPTAHRRNVRRLPCAVSGSTVDLELHHCHSGSVADAGIRRGMGQKVSDYLLIPLAKKYHTGRFNPEAIGMRTWESMFGSQMDHLATVSAALGYDVVELAKREGVDQ